MKNKRVTILSIITNIILIAMLCSFIRINGGIVKEKQIIKEMSESTQVTDLNNQINALNTEHTEYMKYIQTCKAQLASAITNMGVETSENASVDTMVSNIRSILEASGADKVNYEVYFSSNSQQFSGLTWTYTTKYKKLFFISCGSGGASLYDGFCNKATYKGIICAPWGYGGIYEIIPNEGLSDGETMTIGFSAAGTNRVFGVIGLL